MRHRVYQHAQWRARLALPSHLISMAGLQAPLSTLRLAPRDALRMTRSQSGLLFLLLLRTFTFALCRSPGALTCFKFRFVSSPQVASIPSRRPLACSNIATAISGLIRGGSRLRSCSSVQPNGGVRCASQPRMLESCFAFGKQNLATADTAVATLNSQPSTMNAVLKRDSKARRDVVRQVVGPEKFAVVVGVGANAFVPVNGKARAKQHAVAANRRTVDREAVAGSTRKA